jgi:serine/threonine protein kinase
MRKMHSSGFAHRDLHDGNWMMTAKGLHILDWGTATRRSNFDILKDIADSPLSLGLGLSQSRSGLVRVHPALRTYEQLAERTADQLSWLRFGTSEWHKVLNRHYDSLDGMLRRATRYPKA